MAAAVVDGHIEVGAPQTTVQEESQAKSPPPPTMSEAESPEQKEVVQSQSVLHAGATSPTGDQHHPFLSEANVEHPGSQPKDEDVEITVMDAPTEVTAADASGPKTSLPVSDANEHPGSQPEAEDVEMMVMDAPTEVATAAISGPKRSLPVSDANEPQQHQQQDSQPKTTPRAQPKEFPSGEKDDIKSNINNSSNSESMYSEVEEAERPNLKRHSTKEQPVQESTVAATPASSAAPADDDKKDQCEL